MLAHAADPADLGSDLLKISDMPIMMSSPVDPYDTEPAYHQNAFSPDPHLHHGQPNQYYQQQHYEQQYHQFHPPAQPSGVHPHQLVDPHQEYYQQQQMMYCQSNQVMPGYYHQQDQYTGYYQQPHHTGYPYQANQSVLVNSGPSSHGSQNCTPSPHANSDDSGGDCINEPKMLHLGGLGQQYSSPQIPPYPTDLPPATMGLPSKAAMASSVMSRSLTAARRGKKSKHRDPNEPQKPVSAYALFFRDMQAGIKIRNPNSSFGEVSKHVASMWDGLDPDHKAIYKRRTETAKKEYLKRLAAYRASLVSSGSDPNPDTFGGSRFPGTFDNNLTDRKDLGPVRDFNSTSSSSPPSLLSPRIGSPPGGLQGDTSPGSSSIGPGLTANPASAQPTPSYPTTSTSNSFSNMSKNQQPSMLNQPKQPNMPNTQQPMANTQKQPQPVNGGMAGQAWQQANRIEARPNMLLIPKNQISSHMHAQQQQQQQLLKQQHQRPQFS